MKYNEITVKKVVGRHLKNCGVSPANLGYKYILRAIELSIEDETILDHVTKRLYPEIARTYSTTASRVERAIRHSIETAFDIPEACEVIYKYFGNTVSSDCAKTTNSAFLATISEVVNLELMELEDSGELHRIMEDMR